MGSTGASTAVVADAPAANTYSLNLAKLDSEAVEDCLLLLLADEVADNPLVLNFPSKYHGLIGY